MESLDEAHRSAKAAPTHARFVTVEGDVVQGNALSWGAGEGGGLLAQQREMRELESVVEQLTEEVEIAETKVNELKRAREEFVRQCEELDLEVRRND